MYPFLFPTMFPNYDTSSQSSFGSSSQDEEDDDSGIQQPYYCWDGNKRANVTDCGRTILWCDGACKGNHLGPNSGATSGVGVWVHDKKKWKKFNDVYPDTNNVSPSVKRPCFFSYLFHFIC